MAMTRRDFLIGSSTVIVGSAFARPIQSCLGGRSCTLSDTQEYTAADYVQDGLITFYDGIENAGLGVHDSESPTWIDLTGNGFDVTMDFNNGEWIQNGVKCYGTGRVASRLGCRNEYLAKGFTVAAHMEIVCDWRRGPGAYFMIFSLPNYRRYQSFCGHYHTGVGINGMKRLPAVFPEENVVTLFSCSERIMTQNGIDIGAIVSSTNLGYVTNDIIIGSNNSDSYRYTLGNICCIRAYSRELTDEEMAWNLEIDRARFNVGGPA